MHKTIWHSTMHLETAMGQCEGVPIFQALLKAQQYNIGLKASETIFRDTNE